MTDPGRPPTSLIYTDEATGSRQLAFGLTARGDTFIAVSNPLDAVVMLQRFHGVIDSVFVSLQDNHAETSAFFAFLRDVYPAVRRIVFGAQGPESAKLASRCDSHQGVVLWDHRDHAQLHLTLSEALGSL